jgi:Ca2+-binding EF-hand superfamily protein
MFQKYDRNSNGKLDLREFDEALKSIGFYLKVHEL